MLGRIAEYIDNENTQFYVQLEKYEIAQFNVSGTIGNYNAFLADNANPDLNVNIGAMAMPLKSSRIIVYSC